MQRRWSKQKPLQRFVSAEVQEEKAFEIGGSHLRDNLVRQGRQVE